MRISILGAGHGGLAAAADLTLMGHEVKLSAVNKHDKNIQLLKALKKIMIEGVTSKIEVKAWDGFRIKC